jgi:hypothetical protein
MAYCIFQKSLRILEEFRKKPHLKISPKSTCTSFQSLYKFQKSYFILKGISTDFGPNGPAASQPTGPYGLASLLLNPRTETV